MDAAGPGLGYDSAMTNESQTDYAAAPSAPALNGAADGAVETLNGLKTRFDAALNRLEEAALGAAEKAKSATDSVGEVEGKLAGLQARFDKQTEDFDLMRQAHEKLVADHEALKALAADAADRLDAAASLLDGDDQG